MKPFNWRALLGVALVLMGALALLQTFNVVSFNGGPWTLIFGVLFVVIGGIFVYALINDRNAWWAAIPGITLVGLGAMMLLLALVPEVSGNLIGFIIIGSIAASFWVVYALRREFWWAIIPGGVMTSVALVVIISQWDGVLGASAMFVGMAATFAVLALIDVHGRRMTWPWYPAAALLFVGGIIAVSGGGASGLIWAVILILAGLFLVARPYLFKKM